MRFRYALLPLLVIGLFLAGCSKQPASAIIGKWELRTESNGQGGILNHAPGNGEIIEFTKTLFISYSHGQRTGSYHYEIRRGKSNISDQMIDKLIPDYDAGFAMAIAVHGRFLDLYADVYDGPGSTYERIGN